MSRMLDRSKPYGEVWGGSMGHAYEQGGCLFDSAGIEIGGKFAAPVQAATSPAPQLQAINAGTRAAAAALLDLTVEKLTEELPDVSDEVLQAVRSGEASGKNRKGAMALIDAEIESRAAKASGGQVEAQLEA